MPLIKSLLCCLPLTTLAFVFIILCIMYKSIEGHWWPRKAQAPSVFSQPPSLLLWFSGCCINIQVIQILENMLWLLLHLLMEKERPFPWMVFLGTPINLLQWMNCTDFLGQSSGAWCVNLYTVRSDGLLQSTFSSATRRMPTAGSQNAKMDCTWIYFLCAGKTMWLHMESVWQP